jgi:hypothetical protein
MKKRETFEEFQNRIGFKLDKENRNLNLAQLMFFQSIYVYESGLSWRKQIVRMKKILDDNSFRQSQEIRSLQRAKELSFNEQKMLAELHKQLKQ